MRRDRCVLAALVLVAAALVIGHHTYIEYVISATQSVDLKQQQLRVSVFDDLEGYGRANKRRIQEYHQPTAGEIERAHEQICRNFAVTWHYAMRS